MIRRFIVAAAILVACPVVVTAQNVQETVPSAVSKNPMPNSIIGFLKPGMHVGVQYIDGTSSVSLSVYDAEHYPPALDVVRRRGAYVSAVELASKHKRVRELLAAYVSDRNEELEKDAKIEADDVQVLPLSRKSIGIVRDVGDDFVLIETDGTSKRQIVFALSSISRIYLKSNPIQFISRRNRGR